MELELGVKLTRVADEFTSDFKIAKDHGGPLFLSNETDAMFVLSAHLKGYRRTNIKIDINKEGTLITISGEKQVQETVIIGWEVYKKDIETKGFKKVYRIPEGVILDKIKAMFSEDESTLMLSMPKKIKGIQGISLEEVEENKELVDNGTENLQIADEKIQKTETSVQKEEVRKVEEPHVKTEMPKEETNDSIKENPETKKDQELDKAELESSERVPEIADDNHEEVTDEGRDDDPERVRDLEKRRGGSSIICTPIVVGSALLLSFVVFVFQIIRSKNQTSRRKD